MAIAKLVYVYYDLPTTQHTHYALRLRDSTLSNWLLLLALQYYCHTQYYANPAHSLSELCVNGLLLITFLGTNTCETNKQTLISM
jgi:hypothetical protein